jgi:hypothetical protein
LGAPPSQLSLSERNDLGEIEQAACTAPCAWELSQCVLPAAEEYGYVADGPTEQTELGLRVPLAKIGPSLFGQSIQNLAFELFQYSDTLLRLKVL